MISWETTITLECDNQERGPNHGHVSQASFVSHDKDTCRVRARHAGWSIDGYDKVVICPECTKARAK